MKYAVEERFTDDLGITFEKVHGGGHGEPHTTLYFMRKDDSRDVFDIIEKEQYEIAHRQYRQAFIGPAFNENSLSEGSMEKEPEKKEYSSKKVAALCRCGDRAARKWAANNGVRFTGEGYRKDYHFTEDDIERFRGRPRPGRRWN